MDVSYIRRGALMEPMKPKLRDRKPTDPKTLTDVFISYSRVDKAFVRRLARALAAERSTMWLDLNDIVPSEEWLLKIYQGIERAHTVLFVVSPDSVRSEACTLELSYAAQIGKRILPLLYRHVDPHSLPKILQDRQWL